MKQIFSGMMLIADSGSTKTEWSLLSADENIRVRTQGISPYFLNSGEISALLQKELLPHLKNTDKITHLYYYGTGCTAPQMCDIVQVALTGLFPSANIIINYDLVAAAHALCGDKKGIACILGTGSNSGYYNGKEIEKNIPGLGFILGDEGSGAYLGKLLCSAYLYGRLNEELSADFSETFGVNKDTLLKKIYASTLANRLLASYAVFLSQHRGQHVIENIITKGIDDFFSVHLAHYQESKNCPIHFTGSIAWHFSDVIKKLCGSYGFECGKIIKERMDSLQEYHISRFYNPEADEA